MRCKKYVDHFLETLGGTYSQRGAGTITHDVDGRGVE